MYRVEYTIPAGFRFIPRLPTPGLTSGPTKMTCLRHFRVYKNLTIHKDREKSGVSSRHTGFGAKNRVTFFQSIFFFLLPGNFFDFAQLQQNNFYKTIYSSDILIQQSLQKLYKSHTK